MKIIYEDDNIIVVHKEAGEPTQTAKGTVPDLVSMIKVHIAKTNKSKGNPYVGVVHRLDQPVSGLLVFAKDSQSASILSKQLQRDIMNKIYTATTEGTGILRTSGDLIDYMYKDAKLSKSIIVGDTVDSTNNIKKAELHYEVISVNEEEQTTTLKIVLKTGRFHQIRAQLSNMGFPIVGDVKYGAKRNSSKGILLSAVALDFVHPKTKKKMHFEL